MNKKPEANYKRHVLGARPHIMQTEEDLKAERAAQELASRKQKEKQHETKQV